MGSALGARYAIAFFRIAKSFPNKKRSHFLAVLRSHNQKQRDRIF
ncbi:hypothetical protein ACE1CI_29340 [Aerosakkonemataceae cyanobacterium BLCC-F50]|uniref:Uncharacterized protein n=1 Tax=Floridaenema flaviceps BLCC-F50 TaxID=3153642 RepID=A0ABV4XZ82_9CYAN